MNYITLNDKESTEIKGLKILALPPITKPQLRVAVEEIDGRDGDIVTELGYKAYDKTVSIGLTSGYDIDEVIDYFDGEGKIVFSNEPDKYYRYKIYEQIDFERLLRLKSAEVKIHVQPFKYSNIDYERTILFTDETETIVRNIGNIYSRPKITIYGSGTISFSLNDNQLFIIALGDDEYITIDAEQMEAYKDGVLKNRYISGNYDNFRLNVGRNTLSWSGTITKMVINNYSRWI